MTPREGRNSKINSSRAGSLFLALPTLFLASPVLGTSEPGRHLDIFYNDKGVEVEDVKSAVGNELIGPGKLLGYRAMHRKLYQEYCINATRDQVYDVMTDLDPEGLAARGGVGAKKKRQKGNFTTRGSNWVHSLDGHINP